ncbi:hypothetical protein MLD38_012209 [Melastoma candidum]|uniref:Uncharacterized protein n=1 Tax=Melastoma candidum TaxID=119954 RepID=A0ACB9R7D7_9MYRT|nr:hypothetical protein MLD38_012209 [Melastoma candidum]
MGGCAAKLRKTFEAEDKGEKPELVQEGKVKEIVGEIAVVDEIQGCNQRPSLSLLFKQEEVKDWADSEKPNNGKQENDPIRPKEGDEQPQTAPGNISTEQQEETAETPTLSEPVKPEGVAVSISAC